MSFTVQSQLLNITVKDKKHHLLSVVPAYQTAPMEGGTRPPADQTVDGGPNKDGAGWGGLLVDSSPPFPGAPGGEGG